MKQHRRQMIQNVGSVLAMSMLTDSVTAARNDRDSKPRIRVGQIGVGHAHAGKLSAWRNSTEYEVVGIVEPDDNLRQQAQNQEPFRDLPWMTQEQLLNVSGLQAVLVETNVRDLLNVAESCVDAGMHVHLDKPAGESLEQFTRILHSASRQQLLLQMGYMYRYNPGIVMLREFLTRGWLGEVFEVHTVMSKVVDPDSRLEMAEFPGGIMFELGCHIIDLVVGVLGKPEKVTAFPRRVGRQNDKLVDNMLAVFEYPRATATVKSSAVEVEGFARRHFVVCGTEGTFHIQPLDNPSARVALSTTRDKYAKGYQEITFPKYVRYVDDAADMARIIRGEKETDFPPDHDLAVQSTLLQACGLDVSLP
ncbi:MAG: Gfo/Idh/MocA family oxidoreductase [Planctomycetaceae bacterium]